MPSQGASLSLRSPSGKKMYFSPSLSPCRIHLSCLLACLQIPTTQFCSEFIHVTESRSRVHSPTRLGHRVRDLTRLELPSWSLDTPSVPKQRVHTLPKALPRTNCQRDDHLGKCPQCRSQFVTSCSWFRVALDRRFSGQPVPIDKKRDQNRPDPLPENEVAGISRRLLQIAESWDDETDRGAVEGTDRLLSPRSSTETTETSRYLTNRLLGAHARTGESVSAALARMDQWCSGTLRGPLDGGSLHNPLDELQGEDLEEAFNVTQRSAKVKTTVRAQMFNRCCRSREAHGPQKQSLRRVETTC